MPNYIDPRMLGSLLGGVGPMSSRDMSISEAQKALLAEANKKAGTMTDQDYSAYGNLAAPITSQVYSDMKQLEAQPALGMKDGQGAMTDQDVDELIATYGGK